MSAPVAQSRVNLLPARLPASAGIFDAATEDLARRSTRERAQPVQPEQPLCVSAADCVLLRFRQSAATHIVHGQLEHAGGIVGQRVIGAQQHLLDADDAGCTFNLERRPPHPGCGIDKQPLQQGRIVVIGYSEPAGLPWNSRRKVTGNEPPRWANNMRRVGRSWNAPPNMRFAMQRVRSVGLPIARSRSQRSVMASGVRHNCGLHHRPGMQRWILPADRPDRRWRIRGREGDRRRPGVRLRQLDGVHAPADPDCQLWDESAAGAGGRVRCLAGSIESGRGQTYLTGLCAVPSRRQSAERDRVCLPRVRCRSWLARAVVQLSWRCETSRLMPSRQGQLALVDDLAVFHDEDDRFGVLDIHGRIF